MGRLARNLIGVSVKECARQLGISDTAIHKAIKAGRCSQHPDKSVDVEAVRTGMSLTADPFRGGQREAGVFGAVPTAPVVGSTESSGGSSELFALPGSTSQTSGGMAVGGGRGNAHTPLLAARTLSEQTRAEREQIELARLKGTVAEIEPVTRAVFDAMVSARTELLALPDRLTPLVTPETDPVKVYGMIEVEVVRVCEDLRDKLQKLATQHTTAAA